jgi:hypothetical protein
MKSFPLLLVVIFLLSACGTRDAVTPTVTAVCVSSKPTQDDIDSALAYTGDLFSEPDWQSSYSVSEGRVAVTWNSDTLGGATYLEALIFPCGYEELDLNNYFNDDYWQAIFENYDSYELVSECKEDGGVRLYQFKAESQGFEYAVKYWAENDTDTRVMALMLVFPVESTSVTDQYSADLFPELSSCK